MRIILGLMLATVALAQKRDAEFNQLADRFFDECVFKYDPVYGTQAGFHQHDALLSLSSRAEIDEQIATLKRFEKEVDAFGAQGLSPYTTADRELVLSSIRGSLLTLETIRPWETNADNYSSGVSSAIFVVMSRSFAPEAVRL